MTTLHVFTRGLAFAFLDGEWDHAGLLARGQLAIAVRAKWLPRLCGRVLATFPDRPADDRALVQCLIGEVERAGLTSEGRTLPRIRKWFFPMQQMLPITGPPASFHVPWIETEGALAAYLGITPTELDWFADCARLNAATVEGRLRHYQYRWVEKRTRGYRLLETPKSRLKSLQRALNTGILARLPPSAAAHGFVRGRSVRSFAEPHTGRRVVLRLDLEDFFSAISHARVRAIFSRLGYPYSVAHKLAGLCCAPVPEDVLRAQPRSGVEPSERFAQTLRLRTAHLPQGAPTSPALSNLVAFKLDRRLAGLARAADAQFTRYADDLAFSGEREFERGLSAFIARAAAIANEEGFRVRFRKTRVMRSGSRQQLAGLVVNAKVNVTRTEYDALRALLHNAARFGAASQNRAGHADFRAHLAGRIAWFDSIHPQRGERLRRLFDAIAWDH